MKNGLTPFDWVLLLALTAAIAGTVAYLVHPFDWVLLLALIITIAETVAFLVYRRRRHRETDRRDRAIRELLTVHQFIHGTPTQATLSTLAAVLHEYVPHAESLDVDEADRVIRLAIGTLPRTRWMALFSDLVDVLAVPPQRRTAPPDSALRRTPRPADWTPEVRT